MSSPTLRLKQAVTNMVKAEIEHTTLTHAAGATPAIITESCNHVTQTRKRYEDALQALRQLLMDIGEQP